MNKLHEVRMGYYDGKYTNKLPYPESADDESEEAMAMRSAFRAETDKIYERFEDDCRAAFEEEIHKELTDEQWKKIYSHATYPTSYYLQIVDKLMEVARMVNIILKSD